MVNQNVEKLSEKDDTSVQNFVDAIASAQNQGYTSICPRCGKKATNCASPMFGALSRLADIYVCSECGAEEAHDDYYGLNMLPLSEWALFSEEYDE